MSKVAPSGGGRSGTCSHGCDDGQTRGDGDHGACESTTVHVEPPTRAAGPGLYTQGLPAARRTANVGLGCAVRASSTIWFRGFPLAYPKDCCPRYQPKVQSSVTLAKAVSRTASSSS